MSNPTREQQQSWGRALAAAMPAWPRLQQLAENAGVDTDPTELVAILTNRENARQTDPLAALFTVFEDSINHHANQADADNLDWQTKVATLQARIDDLTNVLARSVSSGGSGPGRRISEDPDRFGGTEKDIVKRQQQYVTWRSQILRCFGMDEQIFNTEFRRIQHIASLLKDDAYDILREQFETITDNSTDPSKWHWQTHQEVFSTLNDQYATLNLSRQAAIDFDNLWMTNKPFQNFIAEFNKLATKAGKTNSQKVESLKVKVSQELSDVSTNRSDKPGSDDFEAWCKLFQSIYQDLQEKIHLDKLRNNRPGAHRTPPIQLPPMQPNINPPANPDAGDPMVLDARKRPSQEQCIQQGLCFYCKRPGHNKDNCEEKKKNDAKFGRPNRAQYPAPNQAGRGIQMPARFPQFSPQPGFPRQLQFPQPNPYSRLRAGFVEGEIPSSPPSSTFTPPSSATPSVTPSMSASDIQKPENGTPLA